MFLSKIVEVTDRTYIRKSRFRGLSNCRMLSTWSFLTAETLVDSNPGPATNLS
jgi:hypothetical protein